MNSSRGADETSTDPHDNAGSGRLGVAGLAAPAGRPPREDGQGARGMEAAATGRAPTAEGGNEAGDEEDV